MSENEKEVKEKEVKEKKVKNKKIKDKKQKFNLLSKAKTFMIPILKKWYWIVGFIVIVIPLTIFILYIAMEQTTFPKISPELTKSFIKEDYTENERGVLLLTAATTHLDRELNSFFGWTANDLIISPTSWMDNRNHREEGINFATKMLVSFFSTRTSKFGKGEEENASLKRARDSYFVFSPTQFWFPSSESQYKKGLKLIAKYKKDLKAEKAVFNMRTDDVYQLFKYITSEDLLGEPLGRINKNSEDVSFIDVDNNLYYTQGVVLVIRDVVTTLVKTDPEILEKGGENNINEALAQMNDIVTFNPIIVMSADHDSMFPDHNAKITKYLFNTIERLNDIAESINK